jgi:hypothetical protein
VVTVVVVAAPAAAAAAAAAVVAVIAAAAVDLLTAVKSDFGPTSKMQIENLYSISSRLEGGIDLSV